MWLIVAELKLFKKHPSITQHTVTIHHRFKAACKFKFAHQKKKKKHTCSDSKSWPWTDSLTVISQSVSVCISALLLNETFWRQQAGGLSVCGCQFTSTSDTSRAPHSVTIAAAKPFRLQQAAMCPEEKSPPGQRYGPAVWRVLFPSLTFLQTSTNVSTASAPDVSGSNTCPLVANHLIQSALIKPPLCCVFSPKASRGVFLFLETLVVSLSHSKLINYMKITVFNLTVKKTAVTKNTVHSNYSFI